MNDSGLIDDGNFSCNEKTRNFFFDITRAVCETLNLFCQFVFASTDGVDYDGLLELLPKISSGDLNTSLPLFTAGSDEMANFSSPNFYFQYELSFVLRIHEPSSESRVLAFLSPFSMPVWLVLISTIFCIALVIAFVQNIMSKNSNHSYLLHTFFSTYLWLFSYLARKSQKIETFGSLAIRQLLLIWGLTAVVFSSSYCGTLLSFLVRSESPMAFTDYYSMIDCMKKRKCFLAETPSVKASLDILGNKLWGLSSRSFEIMRRSQTIEVRSEPEAIDLILLERNKIVFAIVYDVSGKIRERNEFNRDLIIFNSGMFDYLTFAFNKKDEMAKKFSQSLFLLREIGILDYYFQKSFGKNELPKKQTLKRSKVLGLPEVLGTISLLGVGLLLTSAILIAEKLTQNFKPQISFRRRFRRNDNVGFDSD